LLGKLGEVKAVPVLVELLRKECNKKRSEKDEPGLSIAKALGRLKDKKAVLVLIECMSTQHVWARAQQSL
jgi:HEAT repeat protein